MLQHFSYLTLAGIILCSDHPYLLRVVEIIVKGTLNETHLYPSTVAYNNANSPGSSRSLLNTALISHSPV